MSGTCAVLTTPGRTEGSVGVAVGWTGPVPLSGGFCREARLGARLPRELWEPRSCSTGDLIREPFRKEAFMSRGLAELRIVRFCRNCALGGGGGE